MFHLSVHVPRSGIHVYLYRWRALHPEFTADRKKAMVFNHALAVKWRRRLLNLAYEAIMVEIDQAPPSPTDNLPLVTGDS